MRERSRDLGGWGKTGWLVFVIILPFLGVFVYLIARGHKMTERDIAEAQAQPRAFRAYAQEAAHETSPAGELAKLSDLRDRGVITEADFQQGKEKILKPAARPSHVEKTAGVCQCHDQVVSGRDGAKANAADLRRYARGCRVVNLL